MLIDLAVACLFQPPMYEFNRIMLECQEFSGACWRQRNDTNMFDSMADCQNTCVPSDGGDSGSLLAT